MTNTLNQLARIPEYAALAYTQRNNPWRSLEETTHKPVAGPRTPIDLDTYDALRPDEHGLLFELSQAVRATAQQIRDDDNDWPDMADPPTWVSECAFLTQHRTKWETDNYLAEYVPNQIRHVHRTLQAIIGERDHYRPHCRNCGDNLTAEDHGSWYRCAGCGRAYTIDHMLRELGKIKVASLKEIATIVGRSHGLLKRWSQRGDILPVRVEQGRKLYDIDLVTAYAERTQAG